MAREIGAPAGACDTLEIHTEVEPISGEWEELAGRTGGDPFVRPGWISAWHRAFDGGALEVHLLRRDGRPVALAPFVKRRWALRAPTNWHTPHYEILAEDDEAAAALMGETLARMPARLSIRFAAAGGTTAEAVAAAAARRGMTSAARTMMRSPVIVLDGDFETYRRRLSKNLRKNLSRRRTRMEELGEIEFTVSGGGPDLEAELAEALRIEASGWKGRQGTAIASDARTRRFYTEVAAWAAEVGILRLAFLRAGGIPIAFDFGLASNGTYYSLKTGYESEHHRLGPGAALTHDLIRHCYAEGLDRVELLGSEDEFKRRWAGESGADLVELQLFKGPLARVDRSIQVGGRELGRRALARYRDLRARRRRAR